MHYSDTKFIKRYKAWLKPHVNLNDCAYDDGQLRDQWSNDDLATFRNEPGLQYVERFHHGLRFPKRHFRGHYSPSGNDLGSHLNPDDTYTIYSMNKASDVLLVLADIDDKKGRGDPHRAAAHMIQHYGFTSCYVEPSTHGKGLHVYFTLNTQITGVTHYNGRQDIWDAFTALTKIIQSDSIWDESGASFDGFYGLPSLWDKQDGRYTILRRGNALKLPRISGGMSDMTKLEALCPMSLERLQARLRTYGLPCVTPKTASPNSVVVPSEGAVVQLDGFEKKKKCISRLLIATNGTVTEVAVEADYMKNWEPTTEGDTTADTTKRQKYIRKILRNMRRKFRPKSDQRKYPFSRDQFLPIIESLNIPDSEFQWKRREKVDVRRLSDFVSQKIADAFYKGGWFSMTCRNTTVGNSRLLRDQGVIDWALNEHTHKKLLDIAVKYDLLTIEQPHQMPLRDSRTGKKLVKGMARLIGPGKALVAVRDEWLPLFNSWKALQVGQMKMSA